MLDETTREEVVAAIDSLPLRTEFRTPDSEGGAAESEITLTQTLTLHAPAAEVWAHLTEPGRLAMWSPIVPDRPLTSEGAAEARENPEDEGLDATVLTVEEERLLIHRWGPGTVRWHLAAGDAAGAALDAGTVLRLEQQFASAEEAAMTAAGWHICFAMLQLVLAGRQVQRVVGMDAMEVSWERLRDTYAAMLRSS